MMRIIIMMMMILMVVMIVFVMICYCSFVMVFRMMMIARMSLWKSIPGYRDGDEVDVNE